MFVFLFDFLFFHIAIGLYRPATLNTIHRYQLYLILVQENKHISRKIVLYSFRDEHNLCWQALLLDEVVI